MIQLRKLGCCPLLHHFKVHEIVNLDGLPFTSLSQLPNGDEEHDHKKKIKLLN